MWCNIHCGSRKFFRKGRPSNPAVDKLNDDLKEVEQAKKDSEAAAAKLKELRSKMPVQENLVDDIKKKATDLNELRKEWAQYAKSWVNNKWIYRYIKDEKQEELLKKHYKNLTDDNVSYGDYKKSFAYIANFFGLPKEEIIIEWLEFEKSKNPNEPDRVALRYSKGLHKVKIPKDVQLIHVSPVDGINNLEPAFRSKTKGKFMYPSKRCFFTVGKAINPFKMGTADTLWTPSKVKLHKYVTKSDVGEAYIDPTYTSIKDGSVMIITEKPIPVMKFEDKMKKLFEKFKGKKKEDKKEEPVKEDTDVVNEGVLGVLIAFYAAFAAFIIGVAVKAGKDKKKAEVEVKKNLGKVKEAFTKTQDALYKAYGKNAKYLTKKPFSYNGLGVRTGGIHEPYFLLSDMFTIDIDKIFIDCYKKNAEDYDYEKREEYENSHDGAEYDADVDYPAPEVAKVIKEITKATDEFSKSVNKVSQGTIAVVPSYSVDDVEDYYIRFTTEPMPITFNVNFNKSGKSKSLDVAEESANFDDDIIDDTGMDSTLDDELFDSSILEEDTSWYDADIQELVESFEYDEDAITEGAISDFLQTIKSWKTSNEAHSKKVFKTSSLTDEEYDAVKGYLDEMKKEDVKYGDYKKAFNKFCAFCHIVPTGTIITKYNLKKGKNGNDNSLEVEYSENTKKIQLPDGIKLFHISKVPNISALIPQFKGKSERGYLYDRPRVYFTINKYMPKFLADYKSTDKLHKYECKKDIKDVYVDPLVWNVSQGAVYVETDSDIPVKEVKMSEDVKSALDKVNPLSKSSDDKKETEE